VESVLKNVSTGVVILSVDGEVVHANQAAANILGGKSPDETEELSRQAGGRVEFYVENQPELPPPLAALVREALSSRHPARMVLERHIRLNIDDTFISLKAGLAPLRNEDGDRVGYLMTFDDLSELERAQRLAAWREVARRIAHEVKNPLTPIQLSAQRLQRRFSERLAGEGDAAIFQECTDVIIRQVEEMKQLVDEFSQFARLPEVKPRPGDFAAFLEESLVLFRQAHKRVHFILNIQDRPPEFSFDPEQMRRVLTNILDNAVAAMNGMGVVRLILKMDEFSGLKLTIQDNGPGLDPKIKDRLFDPHVTTKESGQGLGLAIVRTIISDHGGFIRASSRPDEGATFVIELPLRT
jgi:two-component system nitrogen regulation sensor histidine kinase NtrY